MSRIIFVCSTAIALFSFSSSAWLQSKSILGQVLLERAWQQALSSGETNKAWPWADTWPVAKLLVTKTKQSLVVLEGVSGEAMAFGPGRIAGSSNTASGGTFALGGHRDSHLAFLQHIESGDVLQLQTLDGSHTHYRVVDQFVANRDETTLSINPDKHGLVLVTCYPFNALQTGGPLRYVVVAKPVQQLTAVNI